MACAAGTTKPENTSASPLLKAASTGDTQTLNSLIKTKVNIDEKDPKGNTALMIAASNGQKKAAKLLMENKAAVNIKNQMGQTALYFALINEQNDIAIDLINQGADLDNISDDGESALIIATTANANEIMNTIIKKMPSLVNKASNSSTTPLMEAARFGSAKTINILLKAGANKKLQNQNGKTALDIAIKAQNEDAIHLLRK